MPRVSLSNGSANCIDAAVLFASLFENLGMEAEVVLVPGHAYAGVRTAAASGKFLLIDAALTGRSTFEAAVVSAQRGVSRVPRSSVIEIKIPQAGLRAFIRCHRRLNDLRLRVSGYLRNIGSSPVCGDDSSRLAEMNVCPAKRDPPAAAGERIARRRYCYGSVFQTDQLPRHLTTYGTGLQYRQFARGAILDAPWCEYEAEPEFSEPQSIPREELYGQALPASTCAGRSPRRGR